MNNADKIAYFGFTDFRGNKTKFGIKNDDRSRHVYIIGKTGMGKSTLLENLAAQDILNGEGMCFVDPHGSAIDALIEYIPEERITDVTYFAPFDVEYPISFNVLEDVEPDSRHLVMAGLMASFKKIWPDSFSARMEYILANTLLALLEYPGATLLGVNRMLAEKDYRDAVIANITDQSVKAFWIDEYNKWDPRYAREAGAAIQNKIGQFTANPLIRNIIGQEKTSFDLRHMMDNKKILLVNLSKGRIGESNANLLGGMLITKLYLAAMSRADVGAKGVKHLPPFFFFVDEFQNFANESFADILAEARKYKLNLTVAHQYVDQMQEEVASAIFGNVGTMITFRIGATDAEVFEKQFAPTFTAEDIVNLGKFQIYLSLMIDGVGSRPFSAGTLAPIPTPDESQRDHIVANSRYYFAAPRAQVEQDISKWYEPIKKPTKKKIDTFNGKPKKNDVSSKGNISAAEEMKATVSPTLNSLLGKLDTLNVKKKPRVSDVVKEKVVSKNTQSDHKKETTSKKQIFVAPKKENQASQGVNKKITLKKVKTPSNTKSAKEGGIKDTSDNKSSAKKAEEKIPVKKLQVKSFTEKKGSRAAGASTQNSLADLLKRAGAEKKPVKKEVIPKSSSGKHIQNDTTIEEKKGAQQRSKKADVVIKKQDTSVSTAGNRPDKKVKEVPEDVLKSLFS